MMWHVPGQAGNEKLTIIQRVPRLLGFTCRFTVDPLPPPGRF